MARRGRTRRKQEGSARTPDPLQEPPEHEDLRVLVEDLRAQQEETELQNLHLVEIQRELESSRDRYLELYDFAPAAYVTLDGTGKILEINLTGAALLGVQRGTLLGSPLLVRVVEADRPLFLEHLKRCRFGDARVVTQLRIEPRGASPVPVQLFSTPTLRESGERYWTILTDLTEQQRAQREREEILLRQQRAEARNEAKDRFLAVLGHELRTPLTPIVSAMESLLATPGLPASVLDGLEMIRRNLRMEVRLIDDLLDMNAVNFGKFVIRREIVDAHAAIGETVETCRGVVEQKGLQLTTSLVAEDHFVDADPARLQQVLWNLVNNAIRFTPPGGWILIRTENRPREGGAPGETGGKARRPPEALVISVRDTGVGIARDNLDRVFTGFQEQGDSGVDPGHGLGLGLSIARGLVEAHGGHISVWSEGRGTGATFSVALETAPAPRPRPAADEARAPRRRREAEEPPPVTRPSPAHGGPRILLIEDHSDTSRILARLLAEWGAEVSVADSCRSAMNLASAARYDVVISDLGLPDGSGLELMREFRRSNPNVAGIALSGFGTDEDVRRSLEAGFAEHLVKPVDFSRLWSAIQRLRA